MSVQPDAYESAASTRTNGWRVTVGQAIGVVASVVVFALMYAMSFGTTVCSTDACVAGAIVYWALNSGWALRITDKTALRDWASTYAVASLGVLVAASLVTGWTQARVQGVPAHHGIRIIAVTVSYALVLGAFLAAKAAWSRLSAPKSVGRQS